MSEFIKYKRKGISELRRVIPWEDLTDISISEVDRQMLKEFPNMFAQGYIARNPNNHKDLWYVSKQYFDDNLELIE